MTAHRSVLRLSGRVLADPLWVAASHAERMQGLLGRAGLPPGEALLIERCRSIHTVGMQFAIDVVFLDREGRVVRLAPAVRSWRMALGGRTARCVVEAAAGWLDRTGVAVGDRLDWATPELA